MQPIEINGNIVTMTRWLPQLRREKPLYIEIADAIRQDLTRGVLKPGDRLPPQRDLAYRLGVTTGTVTRAYAEIDKMGLLSGEVGRGSFLKNPVVRTTASSLSRDVDNGLIDLSHAAPPNIYSPEDLDFALRNMTGQPNNLRLLDYGPINGFPDHRAMGAAWLARSGIAVSDADVIVTSGAHAGLVACLSALTQQGECLMTEALSYPTIKPIARHLGLTITGVEIDDHGLLPEALEHAIRSSGSRVLYAIPSLQNPTAGTLPHDRRLAIVEIARRHDLTIIEDDLFRLLNPRAQAPTFYSMAPERTYHITSISKTLSPGLRVGFVATPAGVAGHVTRHLAVAGGRCAGLAAEIARQWIGSDTADRILNAIITENATRRQLALTVLSGRNVLCAPGSCFLWLKLPEQWTPGDLARELDDRGVRVTPGTAFAVDRRADDQAVRICFGGTASRDQFGKALATVNQLLDQDPAERFNHVA